MTDQFRFLRILLFPLALLLLFFVISPRMCVRAVTQTRQQRAEAAPQQTETSQGLKIVSSAPPPLGAQSSNFTFPQGLDAARIQYLVEIDPQFAEPKTAALPKTFVAKNDVISALTRMQYVEKQADGTMVLTRDGALNLTNVTEQADQWVLPIATRAFEKLTHLSRVEDDRYDATFIWRWQPNAVGTELKIDPKVQHTAMAEFAGGEHHWALTTWLMPIDQSK